MLHRAVLALIPRIAALPPRHVLCHLWLLFFSTSCTLTLLRASAVNSSVPSSKLLQGASLLAFLPAPLLLAFGELVDAAGAAEALSWAPSCCLAFHAAIHWRASATLGGTAFAFCAAATRTLVRLLQGAGRLRVVDGAHHPDATVQAYCMV